MTDSEFQFRRTIAILARESRTDSEKTTLRERRNTLQHRIDTWRIIQVLYMPFVARLLEPAEDSPVAEELELDLIW